MTNVFAPVQFFKTSAYTDLFADRIFIWDAIPQIQAYIDSKFTQGLAYDLEELKARYPHVYFGGGGPIFVGANTQIDPAVYIEGPAIIGDQCVIRHGAYLRPNVIIGDHAVVGHTTELKNAVLLEHASAPHFAYIGDSILGQN